MLFASVSIAALVLAGVLHARMRIQNRRLFSARRRVARTSYRYWATSPAQRRRRGPPADVVCDASEAVDHAVANLRLEVEGFLAKVAM